MCIVQIYKNIYFIPKQYIPYLYTQSSLFLWWNPMCLNRFGCGVVSYILRLTSSVRHAQAQYIQKIIPHSSDCFFFFFVFLHAPVIEFATTQNVSNRMIFISFSYAMNRRRFSVRRYFHLYIFLLKHKGFILLCCDCASKTMRLHTQKKASKLIELLQVITFVPFPPRPPIPFQNNEKKKGQRNVL